jgi:hypothetical protein
MSNSLPAGCSRLYLVVQVSEPIDAFFCLVTFQLLRSSVPGDVPGTRYAQPAFIGYFGLNGTFAQGPGGDFVNGVPFDQRTAEWWKTLVKQQQHPPPLSQAAVDALSAYVMRRF